MSQYSIRGQHNGGELTQACLVMCDRLRIVAVIATLAIVTIATGGVVTTVETHATRDTT